jgi:hypothetical protein
MVKMALGKWLLVPLEFFIPGFMRRMVLRRLMILSADAFQCPVAQLKELSTRELLENYARFTTNAVKKQLAQNNDHALLKDRLYGKAFQAGQLLRRRFGPANRDEVIRLMRILYRIIKIDLQSDRTADGIIISQCFFSRYYSGEICQVMAALDQGLAAGLSGGTSLEFSARITEGHPFCRAYWRETPSADIPKGDFS